MRTKVFFIIFCLLSSSLFTFCQPISRDKVAVEVINQFYSKYSILYNRKSNPFDEKQFNKSLDSIAQIYCTKTLFEESRRARLKGYDYFTGYGEYTDSIQLKKVVKEKASPDVYIVSYIVITYPFARGLRYDKSVSRWVKVRKEGDTYKIADVETDY